MTDKPLKISGFDNHKKPKQEFSNKIFALSDDDFVKEATSKIRLSAYANNNPGSDYHWQAHACYGEAKRRGKLELYNKAYALACQN